jgi:hypothetical protein
MRLATWTTLLALLPLVACGKGKPPPSAIDSAHASPSDVASAPAPSAAASVAPLPAALDPTCRALHVQGDAKVGDTTLSTGAQVDGTQWVTLGEGASLTLKHATSGREISIAGPALFRACRRGREQVLLARGKVTVGNGMGARPGAEVLIATPVAGVRYGDAELTLTLDAQKLTVQMRAGQIEVDSAAPSPSGKTATHPPKSSFHAPEKLVLSLGKPDAALLMTRCKDAAEVAEATARKVGDRSATEPLGERAQAHVRARKAARAACTIAASATGLVADPTIAAGLWAEAVRWEGLWESIPHPGRAQGPEK